MTALEQAEVGFRSVSEGFDALLKQWAGMWSGPLADSQRGMLVGMVLPTLSQPQTSRAPADIILCTVGILAVVP
jgi:hypothetical protein